MSTKARSNLLHQLTEQVCMSTKARSNLLHQLTEQVCMSTQARSNLLHQLTEQVCMSTQARSNLLHQLTEQVCMSTQARSNLLHQLTEQVCMSTQARSNLLHQLTEQVCMSTQARSNLPVKRIVLHAKIVAGEVPCWVAQVVKLVPQHSLGARRGGYDSGLHRETDRGEDGLTRCGGLGRRGHTFPLQVITTQSPAAVLTAAGDWLVWVRTSWCLAASAQ